MHAIDRDRLSQAFHFGLSISRHEQHSSKPVPRPKMPDECLALRARHVEEAVRCRITIVYDDDAFEATRGARREIEYRGSVRATGDEHGHRTNLPSKPDATFF